MQEDNVRSICLTEIKGRSYLTVVGVDGVIDKEAWHHMPQDVPGVTTFPIQIKGDGNCLAGVGSYLAYGSEEYCMDVCQVTHTN